MLRFEQQSAFVLHQRPYRETSVLLELLTLDHGRVGAVLRGLRAAKPRLPRGLIRPCVQLRIGGQMRGELAQINAVEQDGTVSNLDPHQLRAVLYLNELLVRLLPRQDPHPELFEQYRIWVSNIPKNQNALSWSLRWFERDLLIACGYAMQLEYDVVDESSIERDVWYRVDPNSGPIRCEPSADDLVVRGVDLLALAQTAAPDAKSERACKKLMRRILLHYLDGKPLQAWRVLGNPDLHRKR